MSNSYSLMIHGGAGALEDLKHEASEGVFQQSITAILEQGRQRLEQGCSALDAVEYCVTLLEDDRLYNAGRGSVLNAEGKVEMDAALVDGSDLRAGAVACVKQIKNPIALACRVLDYGEHVLLVGDGALALAQFCEMKTYPDDYFITEARIQQSMESNVDDTVERGPYPERFFMGLSWYHTEIDKGISFAKMKADDKPEHLSMGDLAINHIRFRILEELVPKGDRLNSNG